jgi:hypothetical protein
MAGSGRHGGRAGPAGHQAHGADWRDAWTGAPLAGGRWLTAPAPLETIPVYIRDGGSLEPFGGLDRFGGGAG